jgi:hypothetical protein
MLDSVQRNYYKIFTGTNQEQGYDKIHLGYESDSLEVTLKKDENTYFHVPYFSESQLISNSSLIKDGAISGPIPAFSDRIFKKQGGYGNSTPWGSTLSETDGTWFCTWLYEVSGQSPIWVDRYYNPQYFSYSQLLTATPNILNKPEYQNSVLYYDVFSNLTFEPGVYYQYFHIGENTSNDIVNSFAGEDKKRLRLSIENWTNLPSDQSIYDNLIDIENFNSNWTENIENLNFQDRNVLSFNNNDFINCKAIYDSSYNVKNEFTVNFWISHKEWKNASSTQLLGNLRRGGYGIFYDNLNNNPYFTIPESNYGHLFYVNQEGVVYNDKNSQFTLGTPSNPSLVNLNSHSETIIADSVENTLVKYNYIGDVLTVSKNISGEEMVLNGTPKIFVLDGEDESIVVTTSGTYIFDKDLVFKSYNSANIYEEDSQMSYDYTGTLVKEPSCVNLKFDIYNQKWTIKTDKNVYCNNIPLTSVPTNNLNGEGSNTNLMVDPENNIWILTDTNTVYKINALNQTLTSTFNVGIKRQDPEVKSISFIKQYNRKKNTFIWYAVIIHNFEKIMYYVTLDGKTVKNVFLPEKLNIDNPVIAEQNPNNLNFICTTDFTGYERRRIFNKIKYNNQPQIHFKVATKYPNLSLPTSIFSVSTPVNTFVDDSWYLITCTVKNNDLKIYINGELRNTLKVPGNSNLNYEYKNSLYIGCETGKTDNLNKEIESNSVIWNGYIDSIKIYDYELNPNFISYFIKEKTKGIDILWGIKTSSLQYIELIERFFKHKMPGSKSIFFKIRLAGSRIYNDELKMKIEKEITKTIQKIKPAYTELLKVEWID